MSRIYKFHNPDGVYFVSFAVQCWLLQDILRDFKKFTSKATIKAIQENFQESRKEWVLQQFKTTEGISFGGKTTNQ